MTFEEWWNKHLKSIKKLLYFGTLPDYMQYTIKSITKEAWKAAQPKWTYCKDAMPTEKDGEVKDGFVGTKKLQLMNVIGFSKNYDRGFEVTFNLTENHFESDDREVIAWMPLPKAPENIDK